MSIEKNGELAGIGLHFLKEAILHVLFFVKDGPPLPICEITRKLQLYNPGKFPEIHTHIVLDILTFLEDEDRVYEIRDKERGWRISNKEVTRILNNSEMEF